MPDWKQELRARLAGLKLEPAHEAEILEELSQHLQDRYEELLAAGVSSADARRTVLDDLSERDLLSRELRRVVAPARSVPVAPDGNGLWHTLAAIGQDLRYGARQLRLSPAFSIIALMSLALGIGANTAIFQLLDAVRMRTLPVAAPQELAEVKLTNPDARRGSENWYGQLTNLVWEQVRDNQQAFSKTFAWGKASFNLANGGEAREANALIASGSMFDVLSVHPVLGRTFTPTDDQKNCGASSAVISHAFWQREFGGDASVVGKKLTLNSHPVEIIGVTPASFYGLEVGRSFDVAVPLCAEPALLGEASRSANPTGWWLAVVGRLKPGWTLDRATAQLGSISPGVFKATLPPKYPAESVKDYLAFRLAAYPAGSGESQLRNEYTSSLWMLLATAGLVLLIACANLANLMLARASAREREIAVRLALGASRARLLRQLLVESLLLATVGSLLGLALARGLSGFLVSFLDTTGNFTFLDLNLDWRVLGFTTGLAILTCLLFGLAPALRATATDPGVVMKCGSRGLTASRQRFGMRRMLVVAQVSLSLVLLVGALLFSRSLRNLLTVDAGFQQTGILVTSMDLTHLNLPVERRVAFKEELLERMRAIPGVESAATADVVPISGDVWGNYIWMEGSDAQQEKLSFFNRVSPDYFKTMKIPLLAGRDFSDRDTATAPKTAIVNEAFVRRFKEGSPVGKRFWRQQTPDEPKELFEIIGLVKDTKYIEMKENFWPVAYVVSAQAPRPNVFAHIIVRSNLPLADVSTSVKRATAEASPEIVISFDMLRTMVEESLLRERLMATLSGFFGFLAALLATIGLYGVMSYMVARRTNEIGLRMALGADRVNVLSMVLREAGVLLAIGLTVGTVLALVAGRSASAMLFGLQPHDPLTLALAITVLTAVAVAASYLPARRASCLDPMVALREE
jgi:putative ABC transport system permease protein